MAFSRMRKTTIYLNDDDDRLLSEAARRRGSSRTDLIREAVRRMLSAEDHARRRPQPLGGSGHTDTARRVDDVLGEGFGR